MTYALDKHPIDGRGASPIGTVNPLPLTSLIFLGMSVGLWAVSLRSIDLSRITDVGLISVLPLSFFASLLLLTAAFGLAIASRRNVPLLVLHLAVQVLMFFGTPSLVEDGPRTASAWRLAGISDYITQHHTLDRGIDVFFNWPGFFILVSFVTRAAGLANSLDLAQWAPLIFNVAYAFPVLIIFRNLALSERQIWIGLWLFFGGNWIGQDYLAPQAFAYFVYLVIVALLLTGFSEGARSSLNAAQSGPRSPRMRTATLAFVLLLFALTVPTHQLTPWAIVLSVSALLLARRLPSYGLPIVMVLMIVTWVAFFTGPYLAGHFGTVANPVGSLGSNFSQNVGERIEGSAGHILSVRLRLGFSFALGALAVWGGFRLRHAGASVRTIGALAFAPFLMFGFQNYGGELVFRTYLFSLPFLALAGGAALTPLFSSHFRRDYLIGTAVLLAVGVGFFASRYGNEKMDFFTKSEVAAVEFAYTTPRHAQLVVAFDNMPWKFKHYTDYKYIKFGNTQVRRRLVPDIIRDFEKASDPVYVILTPRQQAGGELFYGWPSDTLLKFRSALIASGRFRIVFANQDSTVFKLLPRAAADGGS